MRGDFHKASSTRRETTEPTRIVLSRRVQVRRIADFCEIIGDRHLVLATVGIDLSPVVLSLAESPDYRTLSSSGASFAKSRANAPNHFAIHYLLGDDWRRLDLQETDENFHAVQPLGPNHWLLVRSRADVKADQNATVFDMQGRPQWSFNAGDGIQDAQATENNDIWISYFDEGVFGNMGKGEAGLVCMDSRGQPFLKYNDSAGESQISDCYALNVCSRKETWLYYYVDFPLVQLVDGKPMRTWLDVPVRGSHAFAVGHDRVLFCGSYEMPDRLFLVGLESMSVEELQVLDEHGQLLASFHPIGRRSSLHLSTADTLYRLDIDDL
jgi:hypothetical protein